MLRNQRRNMSCRDRIRMDHLNPFRVIFIILLASTLRELTKENSTFVSGEKGKGKRRETNKELKKGAARNSFGKKLQHAIPAAMAAALGDVINAAVRRYSGGFHQKRPRYLRLNHEITSALAPPPPPPPPGRHERAGAGELRDSTGLGSSRCTDKRNLHFLPGRC